MRVAFVSMETTHYRDTEGARRFERVARHLAARGHDVTVFCTQWWDGTDETVERDGVTYRGVTISPALTSFAVRIPALLALYDPDVVHARPDPPVTVLAASLGGTLARAPLVVEWFGDASIEASRFHERAATLPGMVVTPSEMVRTRVRELGATADTSQVIPESIDMSLVRETEPAAETDVVYAHPLDESANVESFLLGLAELRDREWTATIVGDGPQREDYERQVRDLRIDDRVTFAGACDREERVALYKGAHAFVQTAYREYFATELLWAMACGCVGIVEYQAESSAHELIEEAERSFRATDPEQIADAVVDAGEFDRLTVDEDWAAYDDDAVLERYLQTYRDLQADYGLF
ncbi:glycosyltransferase [Halosimplex aquaticum]|uniref:Glycosyltransferase n=1 Tax=Halosimplex aquaticum TaxID=3026162 RepID=A0ABD5Y1D3_9EURY|nr:glycosyltransferase [Halosimplex aquaticum]